MSTASAKPASKDIQIHSDNIELSVYSCWTGNRLLRAKLVDMKFDPKGNFVSIDIDDDESAKPEFVLEAPPAAERIVLKELKEWLAKHASEQHNWAYVYHSDTAEAAGNAFDEVIRQIDAQERAGT